MTYTFLTRVCTVVLSLGAVLLSQAFLLAQTGAGRTTGTAPAPMVVSGSVELTDPVGDVQPIVYLQSVGNGPEREVRYPAFDVTKLSITSDGRTLSFAATLTAPPAKAAYEVLEFFVDADNNKSTGIKDPFQARLAGLEYYGTLEDCLEHELFGTMCAGTEERVAGHSAIVTLEKYGKEWMNKDVLLSIPASGAVKAPLKVPVKGAVVQATLPYAAINAKPGQTIRLMIREACAGKMGGPDGFFPDIVLTLK